MMLAIEDLAEDVLAHRPTDPERGAALRSLFDTFICALAAPQLLEPSQVVRIYGKGKSAIWGTRACASPIGAAFANAFSAAALDLDDGHRLARGHPGAAVIPALLANAGLRDIPSERVLNAIVAGYEAALRLAIARGTHSRTGTWGGIGAAAGIAALNGNRPSILAEALSIAAETAPNMLLTHGGPVWPMPMGSDVKEGIPFSVVSGMRALQLAEAGMTGARDLFEHAPFHDGAKLRHRSKAGLIEGCYRKLYSCCRHLHAPIEALAALMERHSLSAGDIMAVTVRTYSGTLALSNKVRPANLVDLQYSVPYCLAVTATLGEHRLARPTDDLLGKENVSELAGRVHLVLDETLDAAFPARTRMIVILKTKNGDFESPVTEPKGEADTPLDMAALIEKYHVIVEPVLDSAMRSKIDELVPALRNGDPDPLLRLVRGTRCTTEFV